MKKTAFLIIFVLLILGIGASIFVKSKTETAPQCIIEEVENYEIKNVSYNFNKLDGMIKKYEIQVNCLLSFYLDGEKTEDNEESKLIVILVIVILFTLIILIIK